MSKIAPINMRVEPEQRDLLTKASALLHMDRSTFIITTACREAENVLLDQRLFYMQEEKFNAFQSMLNESLTNNDKLKALLSEPSPWD